MKIQQRVKHQEQKNWAIVHTIVNHITDVLCATEILDRGVQLFIKRIIENIANVQIVAVNYQPGIRMVSKRNCKRRRRAMMNKEEIEAYDRGYRQGLIMGRVDARVMKENADGCSGCSFEETESWQMPCDRCQRNSKDYWRAKV